MLNRRIPSAALKTLSILVCLACVTPGAQAQLSLTNVSNGEDHNALHLLAARGTGRDALRALVAAGADVNAKDTQGRTPLEIARTAKHQTAARELMSLGGAGAS